MNIDDIVHYIIEFQCNNDKFNKYRYPFTNFLKISIWRLPVKYIWIFWGLYLWFAYFYKNFKLEDKCEIIKSEIQEFLKKI